MNNITKTVAAIRRNLTRSLRCFLERDSVSIAMELADLTLKKNKIISHINFIGRCLRKRLIPKGFRVRFHPADGNRHNRRLSMVTDSCSRRLMQITIQNLKGQLHTLPFSSMVPPIASKQSAHLQNITKP